VSTSTPTAPLDSPDGDVPRETGAARDVVVGVDGSESALGAVKWAAHEAARRGAPLRILHAAPYLRPGQQGTPPAELPHARRITARAFTVARHTEPTVQASTEVVPEEPAAALLRAAAAGQLLVLGSSATGAADELVLTRVTQRVAARSPQPVVVVPRQRDADLTDRPVVAVLGTDAPEDDEAVVDFAAAEAERAGAPLQVLHTRPGTAEAGRPEEMGDRFPGLTVQHKDMPDAHPTDVLGEACPSPLVVLSVGRGGRLHRDLDGAHRYLLHHCTSPLALVPPARRPEAAEAQETDAVG